MFFACCLPVAVSAQKIAVLQPDKNSNDSAIREKLEILLSENFNILDDSLAETAARSFPDLNLFNLSTDEAKNLGRAIGCDFFIIAKNATLRRESLVKPAYFESYAVVYLVSSKTGRLVFWRLLSLEAKTSDEAGQKLFASIETLAVEISANIRSAQKKELSEIALSDLAGLPDENSPEAKNFRPPLPFRRFKPEYTETANLYGAAATVDAVLDLDEKGKVSRVEITRWAGYGLDESVEQTIRKMQWRAAERNGKPLAIRVLLRYNFKKTENEDIN
ncbi:MAG: energy transducer TonB [Pyrinomonadaceae bacterium]